MNKQSNETNLKKISKRKKVYSYLTENKLKIFCLLVLLIITYLQISGETVFAAGNPGGANPGGANPGGANPGGGNADALWTTITDLIQKWVTRLGGVVMFVGGIMFGLGWKSDDAEQKSRGISTLIAGGIVIAVAAATSQFF